MTNITGQVLYVSMKIWLNQFLTRLLWYGTWLIMLSNNVHVHLLVDIFLSLSIFSWLKIWPAFYQTIHKTQKFPLWLSRIVVHLDGNMSMHLPYSKLWSQTSECCKHVATPKHCGDFAHDYEGHLLPSFPWWSNQVTLHVHNIVCCHTFLADFVKLLSACNIHSVKSCTVLASCAVFFALANLLIGRNSTFVIIYQDSLWETTSLFPGLWNEHNIKDSFQCIDTTWHKSIFSAWSSTFDSFMNCSLCLWKDLGTIDSKIYVFFLRDAIAMQKTHIINWLSYCMAVILLFCPLAIWNQAVASYAATDSLIKSGAEALFFVLPLVCLEYCKLKQYIANIHSLYYGLFVQNSLEWEPIDA